MALRISLLSLLALAGCLDSGGSGSDDRETGQVTATGIGGLSYRTASQAGTTDAEGQFRYYPGERLQLSIGDLPLASDVPTDDVITPLDFLPEVRSQLKQATVDSEGLLSHKVTERQLIRNNATLMNLTRFLMSLHWRTSVADGSGIDIRERVITQLNEALLTFDGEIDFTATESAFTEDEGSSQSPANQLLGQICFYPEGDDLCDEPPTQAEIDNAPSRPEDPDERDPDVDYKEDLENRRKLILASIRSVEDVSLQEASEFLTRELDLITTRLANEYYLDEETASHPASDTSIKTIRIRKVGGEPELADVEAISTRDQDVVVHSFDWQTATVDYFVAGEAGGEAEIVVNFRPEGSYRWVRKHLRVLIR